MIHPSSRVTGFLCLSVVLTLASGQLQAADDSTVSFDRDIRPLLSNHCFECHGPDEQSRESELRLDTQEGTRADLGGHSAVVPGQPDQSELIRRILSSDEDEQMPPAGHRNQLTDTQKQQLVAWVEQGAVWSDQWTWTTPQAVPPPEVQHPEQARTWIDRFILSRLESEGLTFSDQADPHLLVRRLSFDLLGLPPSPQQVQTFVQNPTDETWEQLVDEMLASPHFGERMAVHWLDLVRYADTVGYHGDQNVSVSPYRDYVIEAFNSNMPFDQFTREQLAGDLLPDPSQQELIASGYNKLGMMSAEGGVQPKEYLIKYAADRVRNAGTVWLGATIGCAECHDHKFDPFTTRDFYRLSAFFADIKERGLYSGASRDGNWGPTVEVQDEELPDLLKPVQEQIDRQQQLLDTDTPELRAERLLWEQEVSEQTINWQPLTVHTAEASQETKLTRLEDGSWLASGPVSDNNTYTITAEAPEGSLTGLRLEVLPHESHPRQGVGRAPDGNFVLTELKLLAQDQPVALQNARADFEQSLSAKNNPWKAWSAASTIDGGEKGKQWGWAVLPQTTQAHNLTVEPVTAVPAGKLTIQLEQHYKKQFNIGRFRLWVTTDKRPLDQDPLLTVPEKIRQILTVAIDQRSEQQQQELADWYRTKAPLLDDVRTKLAELQKQKQKLIDEHTRTSLITVSVDPREVRVLGRGNWMDMTGDVVQPGVPAFLPQIQKDGRATRLDLATWLTSSQNPITARVMVNRFWKMLFGTGISKVLDDVGTQGEPPVHPELLDTLAVDFMTAGWNIKQTLRRMVTSTVYRQASVPRAELTQRDPFNRLLARQSRFRLDAEFIRDNALSVSGLLVQQLGGRSVKPYQPVGLYRHLNFPRRTYEADSGTKQYRRGLYTHWQRQFLHPAMKSFDAPAREECTAERPQSNTPLAALVLLNDPSYVEAARVFAERSLRHPADSDTDRIHWLFQQALSRAPVDDETQVLLSLLERQRERCANDSAAATKILAVGQHSEAGQVDRVELASWTAATRAIFNMHEFITRN